MREKRVAPLYAALAEAGDAVARALTSRHTVSVADLLPPAPPASPAAPPPAASAPPPPAAPAAPHPSTPAHEIADDSAVRRRLPTAAEAVTTYLVEATIRGERAVGRTRLVLLGLAFASELLEHSVAEWGTLSPRVGGTTAVVAIGALVTLGLLRVPAERLAPYRGAWISVALDALLVTGLSLPGALWPVAQYAGQAHLPSFAVYALAILAASLRLSRPLLAFSVACNLTCAAGLLLLDAHLGAAVLPTTPRDVRCAPCCTSCTSL